MRHVDSTERRDSQILSNNRPLFPVTKKPVAERFWQMDITYGKRIDSQIMSHHPFFGFAAPKVDSIQRIAQRRVITSNDWLFYVFTFLFLMGGILKTIFPKYFVGLFRVIFRSSLKQRQISEQLEQDSLPSLLLNIFFVLSAGLFTALVFEHYQLDPTGNFWLLALYCCVSFAAIYSIKFIGIKAIGWLFDIKDVAAAYIFIVFVVNKMIGILLLPLAVIFAYTSSQLQSTALTLAACMAALLLLYRIVLTYRTVHQQVKVNPFHFFIYLCAFEIAPLLLIYKGLLVFLGITA